MAKTKSGSRILENIRKIDPVIFLIYLYIFTPLLLFVGLWLKPAYAVTGLVMIIAGMYLSLRNEKPLWKPEFSRNTLAVFGFVVFLIVLTVLTSGIGASVTQYPDHLYRNALFKLLVDHDWPVELSVKRTKGLTYYIGFWLPAALVAKSSSYEAGLLFLQIWAIVGMFIVFYLICERKQKIRIWYFVVFLLFGGADYIGYTLIGKIFEQIGNRIEWWAVIYNYPGFLTGLFWVYNQVIYAWIIHAMIMRQESNRNILFIWSAGLINCTFPSVGMIPFAVFRAMENVKKGKLAEKIRDLIVSCMSPQFVIGFALSLLSTVYLKSNKAVVDNMSLSSSLLSGGGSTSAFYPVGDAKLETIMAYPWTTTLYMYLWFILLEFGLYYLSIYRSQGHRHLFWMTLAMLMACPLIQIGGWIDFCMRGSIPALYCLYEMVIDSLEDYGEGRKYFYSASIILLLFISSLNCMDTLLGVMKPMADNLWNKTEIKAEAFSENFIFYADNFFSIKDDSFFFRYLAK